MVSCQFAIFQRTTDHGLLTTPLACFIQPNWFFDEVVTTSASHFLYITFFDREEAARIRPVFVDATDVRTIRLFFQKRTLEKKLATGTATIAIATSQRQRCNHLLLAKVGIY